jgi:hypothetical protein
MFAQCAAGRWRKRAQAAVHIGHDHVIADGDRGDVAADLFDHACAFVPQDHRQRCFELLVADDHVGVADAGRYHADEYLVVARIGWRFASLVISGSSYW